MNVRLEKYLAIRYNLTRLQDAKAGSLRAFPIAAIAVLEDIALCIGIICHPPHALWQAIVVFIVLGPTTHGVGRIRECLDDSGIRVIMAQVKFCDQWFCMSEAKMDYAALIFPIRTLTLRGRGCASGARLLWLCKAIRHSHGILRQA